MTFGKNKKIKDINLTVRIGGNILENMTEFKYLGVGFDQYLRWDTHIDKTAVRLRDLE